MAWGIKNKREQAEHIFMVAMQNSVYAATKKNGPGFSDDDLRYADFSEFRTLVAKPSLTTAEQAMMDELLSLLTPKEAAEIRRLLEAYAAKAQGRR